MTAQAEEPFNKESPRLIQEIGQIQGELSALATTASVESVRTDVANVRTEIAKLNAILTWRMILIAGVTQAIGVGAILQLLPR